MRGCRHVDTYALYRRETKDELGPKRKSAGFVRVDDRAWRCRDCGALVPDDKR